MPERFEIYIVYKRRWIRFLSFPLPARPSVRPRTPRPWQFHNPIIIYRLWFILCTGIWQLSGGSQNRWETFTAINPLHPV